MKIIAAVVLCLCFLALFGPQVKNYDVSAYGYAPETIRVALYNGSGAWYFGTTAMKNMFEWMNCSVTIVDEDDIINGRLDGYDVLAWPGGPHDQFYVVGQQGKANIQSFISNGGGYFGICGGAEWASDYMIWKGDVSFPPPEYRVGGLELNLDLFPGVTRGPIEQITLFYSLTLTNITIINHEHPITKGLPDQMRTLYASGPELLPYENANVTILGLYGVTGTPAIVAFEYGRGRVFLTAPHPEIDETSDRDGVVPLTGLSDPESDWPLMLNAMEWLVNRPRPDAAISCSASSSAITAGDTITVKGSITPMSPGVTVTLHYTTPGNGTTRNTINSTESWLASFYTSDPHIWAVIDTLGSSSFTRSVTTDSTGAYGDLYAPNTNGTWSVYASWSVDGYHMAASPTVAFSVNPKSTTKPPGCVIATATYGSELAPQVQALRDFRETIALKTFAGSSFMAAFNSWYYSWSPPVAATIATDDALRAGMAVVLQPILYILQAATATFYTLSFNGEFAIVTAGFVAAALIGLVYLTPFATLAFLGAKRLKRNLALPSATGTLRLTAIPWLASLALIVVAELALSPLLMMVATGAFVILTIVLTAGTASLWLASLYRRG